MLAYGEFLFTAKEDESKMTNVVALFAELAELAEQGYSEECLALASCRLNGVGVVDDASVAEELYHKAVNTIAEREIPKLAGGASDVDAKVVTVDWAVYKLLDSDLEGIWGARDRLNDRASGGWQSCGGGAQRSTFTRHCIFCARSRS
jgi:hypothetical protein